MYIGIRESEVRAMVDEALAAAGLVDRWALVLFGGKFFHDKFVVELKRFWVLTRESSASGRERCSSTWERDRPRIGQNRLHSHRRWRRVIRIPQ